jgi:hypothetical protein
MRAALSAVLALGPSPLGFGVTHFRAKVLSMTGQSDSEYSARLAAYDLKKLRGKHLITKMGRSRRYQLSPSSMRTIAALQILRDCVIRPVIAGVRRTHRHAPPIFSPALDGHYQRSCLDLQPVFEELGIAA